MAKGATKKPATTEDSDTVLRFTFGGRSFDINADRLTWGESAEIESYFDAPLEDVNLETARGMIVLAYLAMKRKVPAATLSDIEGLVGDELEVEAVERPTPTPASGGDPA